MPETDGLKSNPSIITGNGRKLAMVLHGSEWPDGLQIYTPESEFIQVGTWAYSEGKVLKAHAHRECPRVAARTQEVVHVVRGRILATIFDSDDVAVTEIELGPADTLVVFEAGHGYRVLENGTRVLEVKNGPYPGLDKDKRLISTGE